MIVEKTAIRNDKGQVVCVHERTLSPAEEVAANAYRDVLAFSRDESKHVAHGVVEPIVTVTVNGMPASWFASHGPQAVADEVLRLARADADLWTRTGWKGLRVRVEAAPATKANGAHARR
jgi:hypothetical protein